MINTDSSRKLKVLQGDSATLFQQLNLIIPNYPADWITVTTQSNLPENITHVILPNKTKNLLGKEFKHAIFDATKGFHLDAFATLTGTLVKGSILILLLPNHLTNWTDQDSLRWNEDPKPIHVPHFIQHLLEQLKHQNISIHKKIDISDINAMLHYQALHQSPFNDINTQEQKTVLMQLQQSNQDIIVLIAKRGRGKSALAGLFTHHHNCAVTAPNKHSLHSFFKFAQKSIDFYSPDDLILSGFSRLPDYLIIDEAAMIPLPVLEKLIDLPTRIFLTTTIEGYEGTGKGFLLKLLKNKPVDYYYLTKPIRWAENDELEAFTDGLLLDDLLEKNTETQTINNELIIFSPVSREDISQLKSIYHLLKTAHYRTTPTDLRRLFDAKNTFIWQASYDNKIIAALIAIHEGDLTDHLIDDVWNGTRRPKGNLVAQSLVAHGGEKLAAKLRSIRINRIAVQEFYRRKKIANHLLKHLEDDAKNQKKDYLSVSFSYSDENEAFWLACGFTIVHVASHKEASSGNYSVMALKAMSEEGHQLVDKMQEKLQRDWYWLSSIINIKLNIKIKQEQSLSKQDLKLLHGFAIHYRPYEASYAPLCRLHKMLNNYQFYNNKNRSMTPIFLSLIEQNTALSETIKKYQLSGRQALMKKLKQEIDFLLTLIHSNSINKKTQQQNTYYAIPKYK